MNRDGVSESARKAHDIHAALFGRDEMRDVAAAGLAATAANPQKWAALMKEVRRIGRQFQRRKRA